MTESNKYSTQSLEVEMDIAALLRMLQYIEAELERHDPLTGVIVGHAIQSLSDRHAIPVRQELRH